MEECVEIFLLFINYIVRIRYQYIISILSVVFSVFESGSFSTNLITGSYK